MGRQRDQDAKSQGKLRPKSGWGKSMQTCLKWSHVRSGVGIPPSMKQTERQQWQKEGCGHSRKGEVRVTKEFVDTWKVREKQSTEHKKASQAIKKQNYFSRRAIKANPTFPHWITRSGSWKFLLTHIHLAITSLFYFREKKKRTWYHF